MSSVKDILLSRIANIRDEVLHEYHYMSQNTSESDFLVDLISSHDPFNCGGWLYSDDGGPGISYVINSYCFRSNAELYYCDSEMFFDLHSVYSTKIALSMLRVIETYSSGISNIYIYMVKMSDIVLCCMEKNLIHVM